ncbi:DNA methyltransferase [Phytoactinopolyspora limicola]|uniref:DNA methyltransferase n=1 Tax=Phytoactinopolyspora limicola TaxID=2715536 RepID=UPI001409E453|nr:DNA methyltransferase [Phytoactinopolyspora limicola]
MRGHRQGELTHGVNPDDYPDYTVHGVYPWSVLRSDSREWQDRKRWWKGRGVHEENGRADHLLLGSGSSERHRKISRGTSRFDPFLAELCCEWYSPPGGMVLDPFAGGSCRGIVAAELGRHYTGIDLSTAQVTANHAAKEAWGPTDGTVTWQTGDGVAAIGDIADGSYDYVLTCPPYHSAERYSGDPRDLSAMSWADHLDAVAETARQLFRVLAEDRFATWVTGDLRDTSGHLRCLPEHTIMALRDAGFGVVNDQVLVTPAGSMYRMLRRWWTNTRSAGRVHQRVITVVKGDRRLAVTAQSRGLHHIAPIAAPEAE